MVTSITTALSDRDTLWTLGSQAAKNTTGITAYRKAEVRNEVPAARLETPPPLNESLS